MRNYRKTVNSHTPRESLRGYPRGVLNPNDKLDNKITQYTNKIFLLSLFIITALLLYLSFFKPFMQDEGVFLTIAQGVLDGKVPYRDFFDHKPPGIYFLLAPVIVIFGTNIWALKVFLFLNNGVAALLIYKITNRMSFWDCHSDEERGRIPMRPLTLKGFGMTRVINPMHHVTPGLLAALLFLFVGTFFEMNYLIAEPFMATFLLGAVYFFIRDCQGREPCQKNSFICGIMMGMAVIMKQTAVVNLLILGIFIALWRIKNKDNANSWIPAFLLRSSATEGQASGMTKEVSLFTLGTIISWLPITIYLFANNIFREAWDQIVLVNITNYPREPILDVVKYLSGTFKQTLPVWILFGMYLFSHSGLLARSVASCGRGSKIKYYNANGWIPAFLLRSSATEGQASGMTGGILLAFIFLPIPLLLVRHYPHYWLQVVPFVSILAGIQLYKMFSKPVILAWPESFKRIFDSGLVPRQNDALRILILMLIIFSFYINLRWYQWMTENQNSPKLREQIEAANYLKTLPQKNLLAENQFTAYYFLTGKEPLTKYLYITEVNSPENAEQITIEKLKQNPDTIVLWPNNKEFAYAKELQEYIFQNYVPTNKYDQLDMLILKPKNIRTYKK